MFATIMEKPLHEHPLYENLSIRVRDSLSLVRNRVDTLESRVRQQWQVLPEHVRTVLTRGVAQLRDALDVPSCAKVTELTERLDALDQQLSALEASGLTADRAKARRSNAPKGKQRSKSS